MDELEQKRTLTKDWFQDLRDQICQIFEELEVEHEGSFSNKPPGCFKQTEWSRPGGGGGVMSMMHGRVFEKVGVNFSTVHGELSPKFRQQITGAEMDPRFWASGISVVAHMCSPLVPAVHMNTRFITTTQSWFGGGTDLTPIYNDEKDKETFHAALEKACNKYNSGYYEKFKNWCDQYFLIKHRKEPRGVGGIFFDDLCSENWEQDFSFVQEIGKTFRDTYPAIVRRHFDREWTDEQREYQLVRRGRYVEFNLVYDRGTNFGLQTDGNVEAILMSLPPVAKWP